ncbi:MAG TPA: hypothetical protein VLM37_01110 [Fibrobacteraceae bacterium]|nr:hypothetical protein [Fibrobacteraceae bacterium]
MNKMCWFLFALALQVFAGEVAISQSGQKVILYNDGTWEPYDPQRHADTRDIRESAPQVEISLKYKDYNWCIKETRMMLEAEEKPAAEIQDSLRKLPQGGILLVQTPTATLQTKDPRTFQYKVLDNKGKVLLQTEASESMAQDSDDAGISNLISLALPAHGKGPLKIEIRNKISQQLFEYTLGAEP